MEMMFRTGTMKQQMLKMKYETYMSYG